MSDLRERIRGASPIELAGPVVLLLAVGIAGAFTLGRDRDRAQERAHQHRDRDRALRVHRQLRRALVRPRQLRRSRRLRSPPSRRSTPSRRRRYPTTCSASCTTWSVSMPISLVLAAIVGGGYAFLVGIPLMRLSGLAASIATFAVLGITFNLLQYWTRIGPGAKTLPLVPETTGLVQATAGAVAVAAIAFVYQKSRPGRQFARRARIRRRRARRHRHPPPAPVGVRDLGALAGVRRRALRALPRLHHRHARVSRPHVAERWRCSSSAAPTASGERSWAPS